MASEVVDGCVIPLRVAGHPVLELCNTAAGWPDPATGPARPEPAKDYLVDARSYLVWAHAAGVIGAAELAAATRAANADPAAATRAVRDLRQLRAALYLLLTGSVADGPAALVQRAAATAVRQSQLRPDDSPDGGVCWRLDGGDDPVRRPIHRLVLAGLELLADAGPGAVGRCGGVGCGWLFLAQGGRRRWCLMPICGNRAKARRHAARRRDAAGPGDPGTLLSS